jgi:dihydrofolate reductase
MITLIAAMDRHGAIGRANQLLWKLPVDMAHFKAYTTGKPVLMGHTTALSVGRALPKRLNLVLSARHEAPYPGQVHLHNLSDVLAFHQAHRAEEIMVAGGAQVYAALLPFAQRLVLTHVDDQVADADAFFPLVEPLEAGWVISETLGNQAIDEKHAQAFVIKVYDRPVF